MLSVEEAKTLILTLAMEKKVSVSEAVKLARKMLDEAIERTKSLAILLGDSPEKAETIIRLLPSRRNIEEAINQLEAETN